MNPKKILHNTSFSVQLHTLPVTPFKLKILNDLNNLNSFLLTERLDNNQSVEIMELETILNYKP